MIDDNFFLTSLCPLLAQAFNGGYHKDDTGNPAKDKYYEHLADPIRYIFHNILGTVEVDHKPKEKTVYDKMIDKGYPVEYVKELMKDDLYTDLDRLAMIREKSHGTGYVLGV